MKHFITPIIQIVIMTIIPIISYPFYLWYSSKFQLTEGFNIWLGIGIGISVIFQIVLIIINLIRAVETINKIEKHEN